MTLENILIATDFTEQANLALGHAMTVARHTGAKLSIMHALGLSTVDADTTPFELTEAFQKRARELQYSARTQLEDLRELNLGQGVELSHVFVDRMPEQGIAMVAAETNTDLIVVGSHGRNRISSFFLGSVSRRVVKMAKCDVMVARGSAPVSGYERILVPTDFSEHSERAVRRAGQLVAKGGTVEIFHCWQMPTGPISYWGNDVGPSLQTGLREMVQERGKACLSNHMRSDVEFLFSDQMGPPRYLIEERTKQGKFDLVVAGTHGRGGLDRMLLGSVAESLVSHLNISTYLVR